MTEPSPIELHHFSPTKAQLDAIPEPERNLLVLLGHAANELSVLSKLFQFTAMTPADAPLLMEARNAQAMVVGRLLAGKLHECWRLFRTHLFASQLSRDYAQLFDAEAKSAFDSLKKYFGRTNLIETTRNKFAFHYSSEWIASGYSKLIDGDSLSIYLSETHANTLYAFSDTVAARSMMESIAPEDHMRAFELLIQETHQVFGWIVDAISATMHACFRRHLGGDLYTLGATRIHVTNAPNSREVIVPYFVDPTPTPPSAIPDDP